MSHAVTLIKASEGGGWVLSVYLFGGFEFTSARGTVSAHKFIDAFTTPKPLVWAL